jgi:hypothetical protein
MSPGNVEDTSFSSSMAVQPSSANSMPQFYLTIFDCNHKEQMSPAKKVQDHHVEMHLNL